MRTLVIIPAYNEATRIAPVVRRVLALKLSLDLLVVDDGSTDDTATIAAQAEATVLHNQPPNRGKGFTLRRGFDYALAESYGTVITLDADGQHPPELIPRFLRAIEAGADLVYGNRLHDVSTMPAARIFSNKTTSRLVSFLAGRQILDSQCGMRAIKAWVLRSAPTTHDGFAAESEQLIRAGRAGAIISGVPIPTIYEGDTGSHMNVVKDTLRFMSMWFRYLARLW